MFKSPGKRTSENEAMEQLRKQRRQASQLQTQYKSMLKEINDILKDDFTQIPCVLNALRSGTYKASTLAASKSSSTDKSAELFNHNVVLWKDTPVNFYLKHLLSRGFSEQALNYAGTLSKHIPLHLFLICYALEGSWKIASKRIETADAKLNSRYDRCGKRGDALATRATFDFISSVPSEKAFWFFFGTYHFSPLPQQGQLTTEHQFTEVTHASGIKVNLPGPITLAWTYLEPHSEKAAELVSPDEVTRYKLHMLFRTHPRAFEVSRVMEPLVDRLDEQGQIVAVEASDAGAAAPGVDGAVARLVKARRGRKAMSTT